MANFSQLIFCLQPRTRSIVSGFISFSAVNFRRVLPDLIPLNILSHLCTHSKEEHGHCEVTVRKGFDELKPLASWASTQRVSEMMSSSNLMEMTFPNFTSNPTHGFLHMFAVRRYAVKIQGETIGRPAGENNRYLILFTCLHFLLTSLSFNSNVCLHNTLCNVRHHRRADN